MFQMKLVSKLSWAVSILVDPQDRAGELLCLEPEVGAELVGGIPKALFQNDRVGNLFGRAAPNDLSFPAPVYRHILRFQRLQPLVLLHCHHGSHVWRRHRLGAVR